MPRTATRATLSVLAGCLAAALSCTGMTPMAATPSPGEVRQQQQQAAALRAQVEQDAARLRGEQGVVAALAARANQALDDYQRAREQVAAAEMSLRRREALLAAARQKAAASLSRLNEYAAQTYQSRSSGEPLDATRLLLDDTGAADLDQRLAYLEAAGDQTTHILAESRAAAAAERRATLSARAAAVLRREAEAAAAVAKRRAEVLVAQQQDVVARLSAGLAQTRSAAAEAQRKAVAMARARQVALERQREALAAELAGRRTAPFAVVTSDGPCTGGSLDGFPNGQLPTSALCPLWGAPGHLLRADAAITFSALSRAFAAEFSEPICVTDSYRSYPDQVRLYAEKPGLAAYPGTSQHGWGRAVDLCGGIQSFGTAKHVWLALNAPRFGWFHPAWAGAGGSKPEPWHFEYGG